MKHLLLGLLFAASTANAGMIVETDKSSYQLGDTIQVELKYEVNDQQSFTEITDFNFDYSWTEQSTDFSSFSFSTPYDSLAWDGDVYQAPDFGFLSLVDISVNPFEGQTMDSWSLATFEFTAKEIGQFSFTVDFIELMDYNLLTVDMAESVTATAVIGASTAVPEPSTFMLFSLAGLFVLYRRQFK